MAKRLKARNEFLLPRSFVKAHVKEIGGAHRFSSGFYDRLLNAAQHYWVQKCIKAARCSNHVLRRGKVPKPVNSKPIALKAVDLLLVDELGF